MDVFGRSLGVVAAMAWAGGAAGCDLPPYIPPLVEEDTNIVPDIEVSETTDGETETSGCSIQPKLSELNNRYFKFSCVFGGCHETSSQEGGLDLEAAGMHARLVNVGANDEKAGPRGKVLVLPGDPDNSFFLQKLEGTMARDEGNLMPDGADEPLDPNCRIAAVRQWILDGALDN